MSDDDDDDPVVEEIPVYLSKTLLNKLYVYQYPVRPRHLSYDDEDVLKSCIKPEHQEVRLEIGINTHSPNYDTSKGEQIALNVDGSGATRKKSEDRHFESTCMDKQILESTRAVTDASRYAVGILHDKEFHLTPVQGIVHLRPSFSYLDKSDKRAKELAKEMGEGGDQSDEEEEAKQVTVKFARQENDRIKRARERSFGYLSKKSAEEPWYHTQYHNSQSNRAERERGKLYCSQQDERPSELTLNKEQYMDVLITQHADVASSSNIIPLSRLRLLPLLDQVKQLLVEAKLLPFSQLLSLVGHGQDAVNVLRTVQQVAVLVRGNWVVRSDILYPKDSVSEMCGIPAELMCRARDYIVS
ncbi:DNA-directed RNA polymerase III subunit RPC5 isoform X2 [Anabrus simplex]|uniref:DNA-directed RNA polymerase III subunit RPC5 isoform X2 n=1 Tax=Anabrus simplex TaxID=316456 RepID=UPI0035A2907E